MRSPHGTKPFTTPFGGPASGLWPSGGSIATPARQACAPANVFADCFAKCSETISAASPGPICGWTFSSLFGPGASTIVFTPGAMTLNTFTATDFPGTIKALSGPLTGVLGVSGQFDFTEYQTAPNLDTTYDLFVTTFDISRIIAINLLGDGSCVVQVGPPASAATYSGTWVPNNGQHEVHFSIDSAGTPTLFIDHVQIPLTFIGNIFSFASALPANTVSFFGGAGAAAAASSPVRNIFLTTPNAGHQTEFCCPV